MLPFCVIGNTNIMSIWISRCLDRVDNRQYLYDFWCLTCFSCYCFIREPPIIVWYLVLDKFLVISVICNINSWTSLIGSCVNTKTKNMTKWLFPDFVLRDWRRGREKVMIKRVGMFSCHIPHLSESNIRPRAKGLNVDKGWYVI